MAIITLTTDFGQQDGYVAAMQGVILSICPMATISTLTHQVPPQDVRAAAFILYQAFQYYPPDTIHCVVVDPGVGTKRRSIAVRTSHGLFVAPDNGVLSLVSRRGQVNLLEAVTLTNPAYQLPETSATFHGRDIFAPVAAHLANGLPIRRLGPPAINLVRLDFGPQAQAGQDPIESRVMHVDRFGNLILDITAQDIDRPDQVRLAVKEQQIQSLSHTFADVEEGQLLAYIGSTYDHLEIAIRNGNAAQQLGLQPGDVVKVWPGKLLKP